MLNHCDYKPVYSQQNKVDFKIIITSFTGDKEINDLISTTLKRNSKINSNKILSRGNGESRRASPSRS